MNVRSRIGKGLNVFDQRVARHADPKQVFELRAHDDDRCARREPTQHLVLCTTSEQCQPPLTYLTHFFRSFVLSFFRSFCVAADVPDEREGSRE